MRGDNGQKRSTRDEFGREDNKELGERLLSMLSHYQSTLWDALLFWVVGTLMVVVGCYIVAAIWSLIA